MDPAFPVNYCAQLKDIFPQRSDEQIINIITIVEEMFPNAGVDEKFDQMVNMLIGGVDQEVEDIELQGAVGYGQPIDDIQLNQHYHNLLAIFPDASPSFIMDFCRERRLNFDFGRACDVLTQDGYEKTEADPLVVWQQLKDALPNADPSYLRDEANKFAEQSNFNELVEEFLNTATEKNDYPTMKDYIKKRQEDDNLKLYKDENFNVNKFLKLFPNPEETFRNPDRKPPLSAENVKEEDEKYAITFLYNQYGNIRKRHIDLVYGWKNKNLIKICDKLDRLKKGMKKRREMEDGGDSKNLALLQEIAYLKHRRVIGRFKKYGDDVYQRQKEEARKFNLLVTCRCCFDDELIPEECYFCTRDCAFCKECVLKGTEHVIGRAETGFPCFDDCDGAFSLRTLQMVLPERTFGRLFQRVQSEELKQAGVDGLETCPFCYFAMVVAAEEKTFKCGNPECMVESCRECRHEAHIPLRCDEIEYDEDVKRRTFIENKMTEALTRTCHSCKKAFIKSNGCNKMTCNCGAKMCYVCGVAIKDYSHFGAGGCPLYTNDVQINLNRVRLGANRAKEELGNVDIKFDPSANLEQFFV